MGRIKDFLIGYFDDREFTLEEAYKVLPFEKHTSIRGRIYENLGITFERIRKGTYKAYIKDESCLLLERDGRDLSFLPDKSIDCIITDHPWLDEKANKGGNRNFCNYQAFRYTQEDFNEKARVLKDGCFLVEIMPSETESNYEYLYQVKQMAKAAGFEYYAKVPWKKGSFVANTGRKAKNTEDVMIFSRGKARSMRPNVKKDLAEPGIKHYMSGANGMLPTCFDFQPPDKDSRIHQAEKPVGLIESILNYFTYQDELVLDQFAGSGVVGEACINKKRRCILIEIAKECINSITKRLNLTEESLLMQAI